MKIFAAGILIFFALIPVAFAIEDILGQEAVLVNSYVLFDAKSDFNSAEEIGGGFHVSNNALIGLEIDSVPINASHYGFFGISTQSPVFYMLIPLRPVFAVGVLDGALGWRFGIEAGGFASYGKRGEGFFIFFLGPSWWKNVEGLETTTFTIGVGF